MSTIPNFSQPAIFSEVSTPTAPDAGYLKVYGKNGALCSIANGGSEKTYAVSSDLSAYLPLAGGTLTGDLLFTDATYDIGKSGATRPRDGFFSRDLTVGAQIVSTQTWTSGGINKLWNGVITPTSASASSTWIDLTSATTWGGNNTPILKYVPYNGALSTCGIWGEGSLQLGSTVIGNRIAALYGTGLMFYYGSSTAIYVMGNNGFDIAGAGTTKYIGFRTSGYTGTGTFISQDGAGILALKNSTNAQTFRVYETSTSSTSFGTFQIKANAGAAYQIGSAIGSAGGTNRAIEVGHYDSAGTFTTWLTVATVGTVTVGGNFIIGGNQLTFNSDSAIRRTSAGIFEINNGTPGTLRDLVLRNLTTNSGTITQAVSTSGSPTAFTLTGAAHTTLTASTEATDANFNLARTVEFAAGALTTQRAFRVQAPTYSFVGASTITTASTLSISGPPVAGTNATITNRYAINVESGDSYFAGDLILAGGTSSTVGVGSPAEIIFGATSYISLSRAGNVYGCQHLGGTDQGSYYLRQDVAASAFGWGASGSTTIATPSLTIYRDAADILAQRRGTNAQILRVYNTYTSSTSHEAGVIDWQTEANTLCIGTVKGSAGGSARQLKIVTDGIAAITVSTAQAVTMSGNATSQGALTSERYASDAWLRMRRANGTVASPTQVVTNNTVGSVTSNAYHSGGAFHTTPGGAMYFVATEDATATAQGTEFRLFTTANGGTTNTRRLTIGQDGTYTIGDACNFAFNTSTGTKLGTATTQKIGFWNVTPVVQQVLATGAGATVDDVISLLQTLGLCKQS